MSDDIVFLPQLVFLPADQLLINNPPIRLPAGEKHQQGRKT
jgi:hypothetical protein